MKKILQNHVPSPMMEEPGLLRCLDRLQTRMHPLGGNLIPTLTETLRCFDRRARGFRLALRVGSPRKKVGWLLVGLSHSYLNKRGYSLTRCELLGWVVILLFTLADPHITWLVER